MMNQKKLKGLYIGRFQPFHLGHLSAVKQALKEVDYLIIGIGSSQYYNTAQNPLTAQERERMIENALEAEGLDRQCEIKLIPDIHNNEKWVEHVQSIIPEFDMVFVGNPGIVKELFEIAKIPVKMLKRDLDISATAIRKNMKFGKKWEQMLHPATKNLLNSIGAEERIKPL